MVAAEQAGQVHLAIKRRKFVEIQWENGQKSKKAEKRKGSLVYLASKFDHLSTHEWPVMFESYSLCKITSVPNRNRKLWVDQFIELIGRVICNGSRVLEALRVVFRVGVGHTHLKNISWGCAEVLYKIWRILIGWFLRLLKFNKYSKFIDKYLIIKPVKGVPANCYNTNCFQNHYCTSQDKLFVTEFFLVKARHICL